LNERIVPRALDEDLLAHEPAEERIGGPRDRTEPEARGFRLERGRRELRSAFVWRADAQPKSAAVAIAIPAT